MYRASYCTIRKCDFKSEITDNFGDFSRGGVKEGIESCANFLVLVGQGGISHDYQVTETNGRLPMPLVVVLFLAELGGTEFFPNVLE